MRKVAQLFISILLLQTISLFAQEEIVTLPDSLNTLSYEELSAKFYRVLRVNNELASLYSKVYLQKGKNENNKLETANGYSLISYNYRSKGEFNKTLVYLDSAIVFSKELNNKRFPLLFYINKGVAYEDMGDFKSALDNYLDAIKLSEKSKNKHLGFITKNNIGLLKRRLGKYNEAKDIFKECLTYRINKKEMSRKDSTVYLVTLSYLVNTYRLNNQIDSALILNKTGIVSSKNRDLKYLFELNKSILNYYKENYLEVVEETNKLLPTLLKPENRYFFPTTNLINTYLHQGKAFEAINDKYSAIKCYKKIDSLFQATNYFIPETRKIYAKLIDHYKFLDDKNQQLFYINRLLYSDSILDSSYKYLINKLNKDYDTPELLLQKEKLIENLEAKHNSSSLSVSILSIILSIGAVFLIVFYRKQKQYQQRFEELISAQNRESKPKETPIPKETPKSIGISEDIVNSILKNLEEFEREQGFIEANITTSSLASQFKTNSKYLSKVINTYKRKSFIHYTNDLRIDFIIDKLKNENKYRLYTIKALASEAGFNTTEAFSKSFYKKTGIYPSYFIKQLEKKEETLKQ
ncbi:hypothetical protein AWE51_09450 [Aquimarina aggregata]|uniref:HTH araC/xylS-type domain-containing protein n=1 Tax=Aquimarina aggregata TaxID=1642818 RepID=A0A162ZKK2_9FLAO|nr:AraC family transcriptional regulator [Aquimarina aggregata]KZS39860.1 hypothetical protein AWE51_09450 [Aquimarina aggregata]